MSDNVPQQRRKRTTAGRARQPADLADRSLIDLYKVIRAARRNLRAALSFAKMVMGLRPTLHHETPSQPQLACRRRLGRELLDIDTLSANPLARRATPVASDVIGERLRRGAGWAQALPLKAHGPPAVHDPDRQPGRTRPPPAVMENRCS